MKTFGILVLIVLSVFLAFGALLFGAAISGFWGDTFVIVTAVVSLLLWGAFSGSAIYGLVLAGGLARGGGDLESTLRWTSGLLLAFSILSVMTGLPLAFGVFSGCGPFFLPGLYHWGGLVGSVVGFVAWFCLPVTVHACIGERGDHSTPHRWWVPVVTGTAVYGVWGLVWLIVWLLLNGSIDESQYPPRGSSPYLLPFPVN